LTDTNIIYRLLLLLKILAEVQMAERGLNVTAKDLPSANQMIVKAMVDYVEDKYKLAAAEIRPNGKRFIVDKLKTSTYLNNFHTNIDSKIVQVDECFSGEFVVDTMDASAGTTWRLKFRIDADVPPPDSTQTPHLGYEIELNGTKKQVGHVFVDSLKTGRPATNIRLNESKSEQVATNLPNGDKVAYHYVVGRLQ
jgi:hypothetical protein